MNRLLARICFAFCAFGLLAAFFAYAIPSQKRATSQGVYAPLLGAAKAIQPNESDRLGVFSYLSPAGSFSLPDMKGTKYGLEDFRGKVVFLNFWATWCKPCQEEWPGMQLLASQLDPSKFVMLAVSVDEKREDLEKFMKDNQVANNVLILHDPTARVAQSYGTTGWPETFVILPDGTLLHHFVGPRFWDSPNALSYFDLLLKKTFFGRS